MPPRYSYWTILAGGLPTAFRAAEREDLLPTFNRIRDKHSDAEMKWFARGRLWDSPEAAQEDLERARVRRDRDWRPGGDHRDPRKFKDDRREGKSGKRDGKRSQRPAGSRPTAEGKVPQRPTGPRSTVEGKFAQRPSGPRSTTAGKLPQRPTGPRSTTGGKFPQRATGPRSTTEGKVPQRPTGPAGPRSTTRDRPAPASRDSFRREAKPRNPRPERRPEHRGQGPPRKRNR